MFGRWTRTPVARLLMVVVAVLIPVQAWDERGALFGTVALLSFTPIFLAEAVPALQPALVRAPYTLIFAGMAFVLLGTWSELSVIVCAISATATAAALAALSRRTATT